MGQAAKKVVAEVTETGASVPKNAQGLAASTIARGLDPAALFASLSGRDGAESPIAADPSAESPLEAEGEGTGIAISDEAAPATAEAAAPDTPAVGEDTSAAAPELPDDPAAPPPLPTPDSPDNAYQSAAAILATVTPAEQGDEAGYNQSL